MEPEHPFCHAKDATYAPPQNRNVGAPIKVTQMAPRKVDAAYRTLPAIHDAAIANAVYNRALETQVSITQRELLSLSPEVRSQVRDAVSSRRVPSKDPAPQAPTQTHLLDEELVEFHPRTQGLH